MPFTRPSLIPPAKRGMLPVQLPSQRDKAGKTQRVPMPPSFNPTSCITPNSLSFLMFGTHLPFPPAPTGPPDRMSQSNRAGRSSRCSSRPPPPPTGGAAQAQSTMSSHLAAKQVQGSPLASRVVCSPGQKEDPPSLMSQRERETNDDKSVRRRRGLLGHLKYEDSPSAPHDGLVNQTRPSAQSAHPARHIRQIAPLV
jgi:hypothetical protein